jgi:hypothetical protein
VDPQATLPVLRGHTWTIYPMTCNPDGATLASASGDTMIR